MRVEDRGESECLAVMAGIRTETLSDAKAGRLPLVRPWKKTFYGKPSTGLPWRLVLADFMRVL